MRKLLLYSLVIILISACSKTGSNPNPPPPPNPVIATLSTTAVSAITSTTATSGGNITSDGGGTITERGICYNTSTGPTTANNKVTSGSGNGSFSANMTGLTAGTTYYVRAYAINSAGTAYGSEVSFSTITMATITTTGASVITETTATSGGNITSDGGAAVTERGICFNTNINPSISDYKIVSGNGAGSFTSNMAGLAPGTIYYVRAYAINSAGTAYGNQVNFTSSGSAPTQVTIGTQVWMVKNLDVNTYRNGDPIPKVTDPVAWIALTTGASCWYDNDSTTYGPTYARLYNWYAVNDARGLAPAGWHIASDDEWTTLATFLGGDALAGGKMKETGTTHWSSPNTGATNSSGFTALPGGFRYAQNGGFNSVVGPTVFANGVWWSSSVLSATDAWYHFVISFDGNHYRANYTKSGGLSVRCVKN